MLGVPYLIIKSKSRRSRSSDIMSPSKISKRKMYEKKGNLINFYLPTHKEQSQKN